MIMPVVKDPHPKLRKKCLPADPNLGHHKTLARRLVETMKAYKAYGIAANQIHPGELVRVIAISTKRYTGALFNPEILSRSSETIVELEGCLSLKREYRVKRSETITVRFQDITGAFREMEFSGMGAVVVQHEIDHLDGILALDHQEETA